MRQGGNRQQFARALIRLLEKRRLSHISVSDIARESGLTRQAFYRYFHSREDLIRWMYAEDFARLFEEEEMLDWDELSLRMLLAMQRNPGFYRRLARGTEDGTLPGVMREYTLSLYRAMIAYRTGDEPEGELALLLRLHTSGGIELAAEWLRGGVKLSAEGLRDVFRDGMPPRLQQVLLGYAVPASLLRGGAGKGGAHEGV